VKPDFAEHIVRFEVITAVKIPVEVFWLVMSCNIVVGYQYHSFGGLLCLHLEGEVMEAT
jgi:hypothetical protein